MTVVPVGGAPGLLVLLVGPKGSGKSTLGRELERQAGVPFFDVERQWLTWREHCSRTGTVFDVCAGQQQVRQALAAQLLAHGRACAETTGADPAILSDYLRVAPQVFVVRLQAPLALCAIRIASRDASVHLPADEALIVRVHALSEAASLEAQLTLDMSRMSAHQAAGRLVAALAGQ